MSDTILPLSKQCIYCHQLKPLAEFRRRTGKRSKGHSRRGACRECRKQREAERPAPPPSAAPAEAPQTAALPAGAAGQGSAAGPLPGPGNGARAAQPLLGAERSAAGAGEAERSSERAGSAEQGSARAAGRSGTGRSPKAARSAAKPAAKAAAAPAPGQAHARAERTRERKPSAKPAKAAAGQARPHSAERRPHPRGPKPDPADYSALVPSSQGKILMRGHSDKGRRWHQEIDLELAVTLVREHAALVVNRRTIRRIYSNKAFRSYILNRDRYTCHFCGEYGDTIDHLLPRAKGGHTTPDNCVCACNLCNQTKADRDVEEFMRR